MLYHVANIGARSPPSIRPALTQPVECRRPACGVTPGYAAVGIEHIEDILADLGRPESRLGCGSYYLSLMRDLSSGACDFRTFEELRKQ
ncbi:MAG: hypothetical protein CM15mP21_6390 [Hyphomicrobiales bacterium]|nr:MAG: hypothetical protein CM15mP21_6390 [Hyphomicrobiales bacterium]